MAEKRVPGVWRYRDRAKLGPVWKMTYLARCYTQLTIEGLSRDHLLHLPPGQTTNILWSIGHITFSHDDMLYRPSGRESPLPKYFRELFRSGVTAVQWNRTPDVDEVTACFDGQLARIQRDLKAGVFAPYKPQAIAVGVRVRTLPEALAFNAAHEGFHAGVISTLRDQIIPGADIEGDMTGPMDARRHDEDDR